MVCICICYGSDSMAKLGLGSLAVPGVSELPRSVSVPDTYNTKIKGACLELLDTVGGMHGYVQFMV